MANESSARRLPPMPRVTASLPGTGGRLRAECEDFQVDELPLYEPQGSGDHTWLWVEKRGIATPELVHRLGRSLGRPDRQFGVAGLKDAKAVTRQWVSIEHLDLVRAADLHGDGWRVLAVTRHRNKLRIGHLAGNAFRILIRDVGPGAETRAKAILRQLVDGGVPNLFGFQRFGNRGDTHCIGGAVLAGRWQEVCDLLLGCPSPCDQGAGRRSRMLYDAGRYEEALRALPRGHREGRRVLSALIHARGDFRRAARALPRQMTRFYVSAWQSSLFNEVVARRMPDLGRLEDGDLAWLHDRGAVFAVESAEVEQARADRLEISPTGPIFGPRMKLPVSLPGRIEAEVLATSGLGSEQFRRAGTALLKGGRRPLRVPLDGAEVEPSAEGLWVSFLLPPGCYATTVMDEIMKPPGNEGFDAGEPVLD